MLGKETLKMILTDAVAKFREEHGEPGLAKADVETLVEEYGGDRNDFYRVMSMGMEVFIEGAEMPERILN